MVPLAEDINVEGGTVVACHCHHHHHQDNVEVFAGSGEGFREETHITTMPYKRGRFACTPTQDQIG